MSLVGERDVALKVKARLLVAALVAALAVAGYAVGGFRSLDLRAQVLLGSVGATLLCLSGWSVISALPECERGLARWRFGPWYLAWGACSYGLASLTWLENAEQSGSASRINPQSVVPALGLFALATVVWTAGYLIGAPGILRDKTQRGVQWLMRGTTTALRGGAAPWVVYGIGTAARVTTAVAEGRYGYLGDPSQLVTRSTPYAMPLGILSEMTMFAVAAAAYRAFDPKVRGGRATLWSLVLLEATVGAAAGGKQSFVVAVLAVLIPYGARRGRLPARILVPGLLLFLLVVIPFNAEYRHAARFSGTSLSVADTLSRAPQIAGTALTPDDPTAVLGDSVNALLHRVRLIDNVAIVMQKTPETIPYRSPLEFATAPVVGLIPRALWPEKPVFANGYLFSQEYYESARSTYTSAAITPIGDLYRHGGVPVVIAGMLLLGMICRLFDAIFRPEADPRAACFVLAFLPLIIKAEMDVYSMILAVPVGIVTATLGARLICRSDRQ